MKHIHICIFSVIFFWPIYKALFIFRIMIVWLVNLRPARNYSYEIQNFDVFHISYVYIMVRFLMECGGYYNEALIWGRWLFWYQCQWYGRRWHLFLDGGVYFKAWYLLEEIRYVQIDLLYAFNFVVQGYCITTSWSFKSQI